MDDWWSDEAPAAPALPDLDGYDEFGFWNQWDEPSPPESSTFETGGSEDPVNILEMGGDDPI